MSYTADVVLAKMSPFLWILKLFVTLCFVISLSKQNKKLDNSPTIPSNQFALGYEFICIVQSRSRYTFSPLSGSAAFPVHIKVLGQPLSRPNGQQRLIFYSERQAYGFTVPIYFYINRRNATKLIPYNCMYKYRLCARFRAA
jgi:hypothetical protein